MVPLPPGDQEISTLGCAMTDGELAIRALIAKIKARYVEKGKPVPSETQITKAIAAALISPEYVKMHGNRAQRRARGGKVV